jgi:hypothetical protein
MKPCVADQKCAAFLAVQTLTSSQAAFQRVANVTSCFILFFAFSKKIPINTLSTAMLVFI